MNNLCLYFQQQLSNRSAKAPCVGFLQKTKTFKHFVYPDLNIRQASNGATTLQEALRFSSGSPSGIPLPDKLLLAKKLALGVLQYHATPWLGEAWRSKDVVFFGIRDLSQDPLQVPYLNAQLQSGSMSAPASTSAISFAPNNLLYSLGIILIELGFDRPLKELQRPEDVKDGMPAEYVEFLTAKRLGNCVGNKLGARYGRLVQKCLKCDFGLGGSYELSSPELQNAVFQDVVRQLDNCVRAVMVC